MSYPESVLTPWGRWFDRLSALPDEALEQLDIGDLNLRCAWGLPESVEHLHNDCLDLLDEWAEQLRKFTRSLEHHFRSSPEEYDHSEQIFQALVMVTFVQRELGVRYNFAFMEGEYDAPDQRNNFIGGVLTGFGGTCASLPILYAALGERVNYPRQSHQKLEELFAWHLPLSSVIAKDSF